MAVSMSFNTVIRVTILSVTNPNSSQYRDLLVTIPDKIAALRKQGKSQ